MTESRAQAHLPTCDIEIIRREAEDGRGETITMQITARPDFRAATAMLGGGVLPFAALSLPMAGAANPAFAWLEMAQQAWRPWFELMGLPLPAPADEPVPEDLASLPAGKDAPEAPTPSNFE